MSVFSFISSKLIHNSYINYIKLNASICFGRHPPIIRRSMSLIVHVCSLWYSHSLQVAILCTCQRETGRFSEFCFVLPAKYICVYKHT